MQKITCSSTIIHQYPKWNKISNTWYWRDIHVHQKNKSLPISSCMPYAKSPILWASNYNGKVRMEADSRNIMCMAFKCLNTALCLVIPDLIPRECMSRKLCKAVKSKFVMNMKKADLRSLIIRTSNQIWPITTSKVIDTIYTLWMGL